MVKTHSVWQEKSNNLKRKRKKHCNERHLKMLGLNKWRPDKVQKDVLGELKKFLSLRRRPSKKVMVTSTKCNQEKQVNSTTTSCIKQVVQSLPLNLSQVKVLELILRTMRILNATRKFSSKAMSQTHLPSSMQMKLNSSLLTITLNLMLEINFSKLRSKLTQIVKNTSRVQLLSMVSNMYHLVWIHRHQRSKWTQIQDFTRWMKESSTDMKRPKQRVKVASSKEMQPIS